MNPINLLNFILSLTSSENEGKFESKAKRGEKNSLSGNESSHYEEKSTE